jgi:hypothetical protein
MAFNNGNGSHEMKTASIFARTRRRLSVVRNQSLRRYFLTAEDSSLHAWGEETVQSEARSTVFPGFAWSMVPLVGALLFAPVVANGTEGPSAPSAVQSLDGDWEVAPDLKDIGTSEKWFDAAQFPMKAARPVHVPGTVTDTWPNAVTQFFGPTYVDWYIRSFVPREPPAPHLRYYLRFGAVKGTSDEWFNGVHLGFHEGGEDAFEYDVTNELIAGGANTIVVRLTSSIGGITQHVALVTQPEVRILDVFAKPQEKPGQILLEVTVENRTDRQQQVNVNASLSEFKRGRSIESRETLLSAPSGRSTAFLTLPVEHPHLWDLNDPFLYSVTVKTDWLSGGDDGARYDAYSLRTGFRDFRMVNGYFQLNGRRVLLRSTHGNYYDPIHIVGTPGDMTYLKRDFPQLKSAGFNMMRFIISAAMPEQLDEADEMGFLIYSEHETSWLLKEPKKFGITLNQVVRRDRNHPSLVLWGLLNETSSQEIFQRARDWLPSLRAVDSTRPVILSSGRWDENFKTASVSNAGSNSWDVYLGGEDPVNPQPTGNFKEMGAYHSGTGDAHIYPTYPLSWRFVTDFAKLDRANHPFLLSESGIGSSYDAIGEKRELEKAHAPDTAIAWTWINPAIDGIRRTWSTYDLNATYPVIEQMFVDSALEASRQRELIFNIVRSNPKVNGYSLTSLEDFWGAAEGVMDNFREFKPGHLEVLRAGWAPMRWCLYVNPINTYSDRPIHIRVALANEDVLAAGDYPVTLRITGTSGVVWKRPIIAQVLEGGPLAYTLFDEDVRLVALKEGSYTLEASFDHRANAPSDKFPFTVTSRASLPSIPGPVTTAGLNSSAIEFLVAHGATPREYAPGEKIEDETILVGSDFKGNASGWRALYTRAAQGGHIIFLSSEIFNADKVSNKWLPLPIKGDQNRDTDWLYHKDVLGKVNHPVLSGLQTKLMTPEYYGLLLDQTHFFHGMTVPEDAAAVAIRSTATNEYHYLDGLMLGTYRFYAGHFTLNAFNILGTIGSPATDRLMLNLVVNAHSDATRQVPLPADFDAAMDRLGIRD